MFDTDVLFSVGGKRYVSKIAEDLSNIIHYKYKVTDFQYYKKLLSRITINSKNVIIKKIIF